MVEIELSMIPDADVDLKTMTTLVGEFEKARGIKVNIHTMQWGTAWLDLLTFASRGKGPDVSHVGGTWVSSLAIMNALRPFRLEEVQEMGGSQAFMVPTWQSALLVGDERIWAVPWTGYIYVICYRKDLLRQAGISDYRAAFSNHEAVIASVKKLCSSRLDVPWVMERVPPPYTDMMHTAASWIWGAGGDLVDEKGETVCFNSPEAMKGLAGWLEIHRAVPEAYSQLTPVEAVNLFARGRAAVVVADNRSVDNIVLGSGEPVVRENLGISNLTEVPWCGGGSFVIWKHTQGYPERARAAVELVKYLTSKEAEIRWARSVHSLMARVEVLAEVYPEYHPLHNVVSEAAESGRAYHTIPLWRRLEYQIAQELNAILLEARQNPSAQAEAILHQHLDPLAERLNLTLTS